MVFVVVALIRESDFVAQTTLTMIVWMRMVVGGGRHTKEVQTMMTSTIVPVNDERHVTSTTMVVTAPLDFTIVLQKIQMRSMFCFLSLSQQGLWYNDFCVTRGQLPWVQWLVETG